MHVCHFNTPPLSPQNHLWIFVNCQVENPCFDSQTKENLTLKAKNFGSTCPLPDKFIKQVIIHTLYMYMYISHVSIICTVQ